MGKYRLVGEKRAAKDSDGVTRTTGDVADFPEELVERLPDWFEKVAPPKPKAEPKAAAPKKTKKTRSKKAE